MTTANLALDDPTPLLHALAQMNDVAPMHWGRYVPCGYCNAPRGQECSAVDGPARHAHAPRYRAGLGLHATLWLLTNGFAGDVVGETQ